MITTEPNTYKPTFAEITATFPKRLADFDPVKNAFPIAEVFGAGNGAATSLQLLQQKGVIEQPEDFKGLYVLVKDDFPFYVGISRKVVQRIQQHVKGGSHYSASLAYKIGLGLHREHHREDFTGKRADLSLDFIKEVQGELMQQRIAICPVEDDMALYLFEVYCAMELRTPYNEFRTH